MNKYDFLSRLRNALSPLPQEERDAAMNYYEEFFSDAGEDNEQAVIASLGTPEELAKSIIDENNRENPANNQEYAADSQTASGFENNSGFVLLAIYPLCKLAVKGTKACIKGIGSLFNKLTGKKEVSQ